jgi:hypothetical protein
MKVGGGEGVDNKRAKQIPRANIIRGSSPQDNVDNAAPTAEFCYGPQARTQ